MQGKQDNDVIEINFLELFETLLRRWWIVLLSGVILASFAFVISAFLIEPKYESTTGIYVMSKQENSNLTYSDAQISTLLTKDYEELITCRYVLETVIEQCALNDEYEGLKDRVSVQNAQDTRIIYITVKDTNPAKAQSIANRIREVASEHIKAVTEVEAVNVVDQANMPKSPSEPSVRKWTLCGALAGFLISVVFLAFKYLTNDTIKTSDDVEKYLGWSTLATIPIMSTRVEKKAVKKSVKSTEAEQ